MPGLGLAWTGDTGVMLRWVNWLARGLGFAWVGVVTFVISPPHGAYALPVQVAGYCLAGLGVLGWILADVRPLPGRLGAAGIPLLLGLIAVGHRLRVGGGRRRHLPGHLRLRGHAGRRGRLPA